MLLYLRGVVLKPFDRQEQTTNETFDKHLVPNIHVATFPHAWSQMEHCEYGFI